MYNLSFSQAAVAAGHGVAGLTQRVLFVEILGWFVAMGWLAYRRATASIKTRVGAENVTLDIGVIKTCK